MLFHIHYEELTSHKLLFLFAVSLVEWTGTELLLPSCEVQPETVD